MEKGNIACYILPPFTINKGFRWAEEVAAPSKVIQSCFMLNDVLDIPNVGWNLLFWYPSVVFGKSGGLRDDHQLQLKKNLYFWGSLYKTASQPRKIWSCQIIKQPIFQSLFTSENVNFACYNQKLYFTHKKCGFC